MHAVACEDTYAKYSRWDTVTRVRSTLGPGTWTREACVLAQRAASIAAEIRCVGLSSGMDFDGWLGVSVKVGSKEKILPTRVQNALKEAWDKDILEEDDVPLDDVTLDDVQLEDDLKVLLRAFADGSKVLRAEKYATDEEKLSAWFRARFSNKSTVLLAGTASKVIMTPEFEDDMKEQGMQNPEELFMLELALLLGRAVVPSELAGAQYGQPPGSMAGAVASAKTSKGLGVSKTLDALLLEAKKTGDVGPVTKHFTETSNRLSNSSLMAYNGRAANQILAFYNKARSNLRDDLALIIYFIECRTEYQGRGLPLPRAFDAELAFSAKEQAAELYKSGKAPGGGGVTTLSDLKAGPPSTVAGGSVSGSSIGPSASEVAPSVVAEMTRAMSGMQEGMAGLMSRLDELEKNKKGPTTCFNCGGTGHSLKTCTEPIKSQYKKLYDKLNKE